MADSNPTTIEWKPDPLYASANRVERAIVGDYELNAFDVPPHGKAEAFISWELYGPPDHNELLEWGEADTFEGAKAKAVAALQRAIADASSPS